MTTEKRSPSEAAVEAALHRTSRSHVRPGTTGYLMGRETIKGDLRAAEPIIRAEAFEDFKQALLGIAGERRHQARTVEVGQGDIEEAMRLNRSGNAIEAAAIDAFDHLAAEEGG